jgi:hypothetical protein
MIDQKYKTESKHPVQWLMYGALGIIAAAVALVLYWNLVPLDVIEVRNQPIPVRPPVNSVGNAEILTHNFCKLTNDKGTVRISFVGDTREVFLPVATENSPKRCNEKVDLPVIIPQDLTPGKYHVHFRATYNPNPLRTVVEEWDSQEFNVE